MITTLYYLKFNFHKNINCWKLFLNCCCCLFVVMLNFNWVNDAVIVLFFLLLSFLFLICGQNYPKMIVMIYTHTHMFSERESVTHTHKTHNLFIIIWLHHLARKSILELCLSRIAFPWKICFHDVQFITTNYTSKLYFSLRR